MNRRLSLCLALILTIVVGLTFWQARNHGFSKYDDRWHVADNGYILPPTPANFWFFWRLPFNSAPVPGVQVSDDLITQPYRQIYAPLSFTTWGLLAYIAPAAPGTTPIQQTKRSIQLDPAVYHSFNLLLHVTNVLLVFLFLRRLLENEWGAFAGAAVFGLHPLAVEPVVWVTGMNNLLSAMFSLVALIIYEGLIRRPKWYWGAYLAATLCFAAAVLAKPSSTPLPVIALLLAWAVGQWRRRRILEVGPWFLISALSILTNKLLQGQQVQDPLIYAAHWYQRPLLEGDALAFYLAKTIFPVNLGPDYGRRPDIVLSHWWGYVTWLVPLTALLLLAWLWKRSSSPAPLLRLGIAGVGIFLITLVPTSGIVPFYYHAFSTVADRYMYFALVGVALGVGILITAWMRRPVGSPGLAPRLAVLIPLLTCLAVVLGGLSAAQVNLWRDDKYIWGHVLRNNPESPTAYLMLGYAAIEQHDLAGALQLYRKGLTISPNNMNLLAAAGITAANLSDQSVAMGYYRRILRTAPKNVDANYKIGVAMEQAGRYEEARRYLTVAEQNANPPHGEIFEALGMVAGKMGDPIAAEKHFRQALDVGVAPASAQLYLGIALAQQGRLNEAIDQWVLSLSNDPNRFETYLNIGLAYLKLGDMEKAENALRRALRLKDDSAPAHFNLGLVFERQNRRQEAVQELEQALALERGNPDYKKALERLRH